MCAVAAIDTTGLVAHKVQELATRHQQDSRLPKALNRELWLQMFTAHILPMLQPHDERRLPRSVVVIDNASLHWGSDDDDEATSGAFVNALDALIRSQTSINPRTGRTVHSILIYTPPYCPRSNAIEAGFKTMNDYIKQHEDGISKTDPAQAITNGLQAVTGKLALKLVKQSNYDVMSWLYTG